MLSNPNPNNLRNLKAVGQSIRDKADDCNLKPVDRANLIFEQVEKLDLRLLSSINISDIFYRIAKLTKEDPAVKQVLKPGSNYRDYWEGLSELFVEQLNQHNADSQSTSMTAWSFATLGIKENGFFNEISLAVRRQINEFNPQNIANTAWAFATLGIKDEALFETIALTAKNKLSSFTSQNISNVTWAFAALGIKDQSFFKSLSNVAKFRISKFNAQDITSTAWAFATLGIKDTALFKALSLEVKNKIQDFSPQNISNTAWAFAILGIKDSNLFKLLSLETNRRIGSFDSRSMANTAWAFCITDDLSYQGLIKKLADYFFLSECTEYQHHRQFHHSALTFEIIKPGQYLEGSEKILKSSKFTSSKMNGFESSVLRELSKARIVCQNHEVIEGIAVDFTFESPSGQKVVLECDGDRYHLLSDGSAKGADIIQDKIFGLCGYKVIHILDSEWYKALDKQKLLLQKINAVQH